MIRVKIAEESEAETWTAFIRSRHADHHAFDWRWREVLRRTFGHRSYYLIAYRGETTVGVLPLVYLKSFLFGRSLISVPYLNGGGILADSREVSDALLDQARALGRELRVRYIELRHRTPLPELDEEVEARTHKAAIVLPLVGDAEEQFRRFPAKLRSQIRRPTKSGVIAEVIPGRGIDRATLRNFYSVFARNMRDLGTPVYPYALFSNTLKAFPECTHVILVTKDRLPIAAGITLGWSSVTEIPWASSLRRYNALSANMLLYWEAIRTACTAGYRAFDFGRSTRDSGPYKFKQQWGGTPLDLFWYTIPVSSEHTPDVNPNNPKFKALVSCWRLLPLPIANTLGPWITRSIP